jgi:transposase
MKACSEGLRRMIVEAVRGGASKRETASPFGVNLSSVKRFTRMEREGDLLTPKRTADLLRAPTPTGGCSTRTAPSAPERRCYLERTTGEPMSDSTVRRLAKSLGHSRKDHPSPPSATGSRRRPGG